MGEKPVIVALDVQTKQEADQLLASFNKEPLYVKVGMELFYREGVSVLESLKSAGHQVFLDLKLHDIPTTVKRAMKQLASFEVDLVNVHAFGGRSMMEAAMEGLYAGTPAGIQMPKAVAVTQLTSTTDDQVKKEQSVSLSLENSVLQLAGLADKAGMDGVVCSAKEAGKLKAACGDSFLCITPGIRRLEDAPDDQKRVVTPAQAAQNRADAIVAGRGITSKKDPLDAYLKYKREWENAWKQLQQ
ncbi:MAG: orotidine-5'-phosphate decarboxylase [Alkalicoccus sp.]|nr:MAG: orotidine-5'-phosphate decarboxylase [Alkalicoccus sp.]